MNRSAPPEDMAHELAALARLRLSDDEARSIGSQLDTVLAYLRCLAEADVDGVPEFEHESDAGDQALRADTPGPDGRVEAILAGVPKTRGSLVAVPKFKD